MSGGSTCTKLSYTEFIKVAEESDRKAVSDAYYVYRIHSDDEIEKIAAKLGGAVGSILHKLAFNFAMLKRLPNEIYGISRVYATGQEADRRAFKSPSGIITGKIPKAEE